MHKAQLGDRVRIQYCQLPEDGQVNFYKHLGEKTCEFTVGGKEVDPTVSVSIVGMMAGERKQLTLQPNARYETFALVNGNSLLADNCIEVEVTLLSLDSSADANHRKQQFEMGGES